MRILHLGVIGGLLVTLAGAGAGNIAYVGRGLLVAIISTVGLLVTQNDALGDSEEGEQ